MNKLGKFDMELDLQGSIPTEDARGVTGGLIPFGANRGSWLSTDMDAPITRNKLDPKIWDDLIIDISMEEVDEDIVQDNSGMSNLGITINDYLMTTETSYTTSFNTLVNEPSILKIKRATNKNRKPF
jgi:hypothetical protein